jgi:ABC-2 type transport system ATP-binding protein
MMPNARSDRPEPVVQVRGLTMRFGGKLVHENVDLDVYRGETLAIVGGSGSGKTTLLREMTLLQAPSAGTIRLFGRTVTGMGESDRLPLRRRLGVLFQNGALFGGQSVLENVGAPLREHTDLSSETIDGIARIKLALTGLTPADGLLFPSQLSGGMRKRAALARAIALDPELLFLDEPTTGLDPQARARMWDEIRKLRKTGTTVFLTTHYLEEADALCDRLAIIDHGRIVAEGSPSDLKRQIAGDVVTVGVNGHGDRVVKLLQAQPFVREACLEDGLVRLYVDRGEEAVPSVLRLLDRNGLAPSTMNLHRPSLDDVFLKKTGRSLRESAA